MDCVTGSPMADTCVRQVVVIDDGVKCPRDTQQETAPPGGLRGGSSKRAWDMCFARRRLVTGDVGGGCMKESKSSFKGCFKSVLFGS